MNEVNQNIVEFLKKVAADEELQAKMQKATNQDEAYAVASAVQDGFTKQEFVEVMQALNTQTANELSDDDLNKVAGGSVDFAIKWSNHTNNRLTEFLKSNNPIIGGQTVSQTAKSAAL